MKITTKRGDNGTTDSYSGERVLKNEASVEFYGCIDEFNAFMGLFSNYDLPAEVKRDLAVVKPYLLPFAPDAEALNFLDTRITELENNADVSGGFVHLDKNLTSATLNVLRTLIRKTERRAVDVTEVTAQQLQFLNRFSDYLFLLALKYNK